MAGATLVAFGNNGIVVVDAFTNKNPDTEGKFLVMFGIFMTLSFSSAANTFYCASIFQDALYSYLDA